MLHPSIAALGMPLFDHLPVGLILYRLEDPADDLSLTLVGFNPASVKMLSNDLSLLVGKRMIDAFPAVDRKRVALYAEVARKQSQHVLGEQAYGDTSVARSTFLITAIGIGDGVVAVIIENLTVEKRATAFIEAIVENLPNMVFVKEAKELRFERFNRAGEKLLGLDRSALLGKNDFDFFPPEQAKFFQDRDRAALASEDVVDIPEEPIQTASGQRWLHTRKVPIRDASGLPQYLLGISEDITERKLADERMLELVAALEASNAELDAFTYSVSHDLRAPLRAIDGFSKMLIEDHGNALNDDGRRLAGVIARNAVKMGQLIDDLLAFSRMGRKPVDRLSIDMAALARAAADDVNEPERQIAFKVGTLPPARGDRALLRQVWVNLLSNAVKYTRTRATAAIEVTGAREGEMSVYRVNDNGVGFDPRYQAKLFGVFERLHAASEYEGTGVGLALVQRIVKRHGGWVKAESVLGHGATFIFGIPG